MSRVALLTPYAHPVPGGISTFVDGLARLLERNAHEVAIFTGEGGGDIPGRGNLGKGSVFRRNAYRRLMDFSPQVIHAHSHWYTLAAGVQYVTRFPGPRLVFSFHTTVVPRRKRRFKRLLRNTDITTFVSATQLAEVRERLRLDGDLRLLIPSTDIQPVHLEKARQWALDNGLTGAHPILMFAGPLEYAGKVAGVLDLIRAMDEILRTFPMAKLVILGDGRFRPLVARAAAGLGDRVVLPGFVSEPKNALANADIYCHISYQESFGIAILEAMSLGKCIVASPTGGIPELIDGENGILLGGGPKRIAEVVCNLTQDPEIRGRLGRTALDTVARLFTWDSRLNVVSSIYGTK